MRCLRPYKGYGLTQSGSSRLCIRKWTGLVALRITSTALSWVASLRSSPSTYIQQTPQTQHQNLHATNTTNSTSKPTFNKHHKLNIKTYIQQTPQTQHQNLHSTNTTNSTSKPTFNKHHKLNIKTYIEQTPQSQHQNLHSTNTTSSSSCS